MTSALSGLSVLGVCVLIAGQLLAPQRKTYAEERYDTVDFTSDDDGVFALDGELESDEFLFEPLNELLDVPHDESEDRVSVLPGLGPAPQQTPVPAAVPPQESTARLVRGLANIVSHFSIQLAEEISAKLAEDSVDDSAPAEESRSEVDALEFESIDDDAAEKTYGEIETDTTGGVLTITPDDLVLSVDDELQQGLLEIEIDLAELDAQRALIAKKRKAIATEHRHLFKHRRPKAARQSKLSQEIENDLNELAVDLSEAAANAAETSRRKTGLASQENVGPGGMSAEAQKRTESTGIGGVETGGGSLGVRKLPVRKLPVAELSPDKRYQPHRFQTATDVVVHDVPTVGQYRPAPAMSPLPGETSNVAEASRAEANHEQKGGAPQSATPPPPPKRNLVSVLGGRAKLDARHWPLIGDTTARYVLVELFDYTCPHCRRMNQHIREARQRYGSQLAVMTLAVPLSRDCNDTIVRTKARHQAACELARLAVAVWRVSPEAFAVYHDWLFEPEHGRTTGEAWSYASQLVGSQPLQAEMAKATVNQFIRKHVELYKRAGKGTVPKLMFPTVTIRGEMSSADALCEILGRELFDK